ncbi:PcfJ domain-containing protein [Umboniibacter marinipuniceus]|uniref:PcfJ-like protein n=1 Tax=Umboniibacter marinipuniceus TaxID=569599 RepID=A0A3M0AC09_9GAMM|nr:PcfJ domain-containing protein [Umboniibacter marinipuniceus]RMA82703.1 PcfJ-like protein [Umboniibacter marinipuniceus]
MPMQPELLLGCLSNGDLRLDASDALGYPCVNIVKTWSDRLEVYNGADGDQPKEQVYLFDIPISLEILQKNVYAEYWIESIPKPILNSCLELPSIQLFVLHCVANSRDAADLLLSNPALCYLWAWVNYSYLQSRPGEIDTLLDQLHAKQLNILRQIAPRAPKAAVKLLKRLDVASIDPFRRNALLTILQDATLVLKLSHQQALCFPSLLIADRYSWAVNQRVFGILIRLQRQELRLLDDAIAMSDGRAIQALARCETWPEVVACHDRWAREWNRGRLFEEMLLRDDRGIAIAFPPPPVEPTSDICWLATPDEVMQEGRNLRHCISSYVTKVQRGEYAVYHLREPYNVTIGLRRSALGWQLDQIRGVCNRSPTTEEHSIVDEWLRAKGLSLVFDN